MGETIFELWKEDKEKYSQGSFFTYLFRAYGNADGNNKKKLESVFPECFLMPYELAKINSEYFHHP